MTIILRKYKNTGQLIILEVSESVVHEGDDEVLLEGVEDDAGAQGGEDVEGADAEAEGGDGSEGDGGGDLDDESEMCRGSGSFSSLSNYCNECGFRGSLYTHF